MHVMSRLFVSIKPWVFPWLLLGDLAFHEAFLKAGDAPVYVGYGSMTCYLSKLDMFGRPNYQFVMGKP